MSLFPVAFAFGATPVLLTGGTAGGDMTGGGGVAAARDGTTAQADAASASKAGAGTGYVSVQYTSAKTVTRWLAYATTDADFAASTAVVVTLDYSDDGAAWTNADTVGSATYANSAIIDRTITLGRAAAYWRVMFNSAANKRCAEIEFHGY